MATTIFLYLFGINLITFIIYGIDKLKAKKGKWRTPEACLLGLAVIGGSIGAYLGIKVWHTSHYHPSDSLHLPCMV